MNTDPKTFLREELPRLFRTGVDALRDRAAAGDEGATKEFEDVTKAFGAARLCLEGSTPAEVWLAVREGAMTSAEVRPEGLPARFSVGVDADAARSTLQEMNSLGLIDKERAPLAVARAASAEAQKTLDGHVILFHLTVDDLPGPPDSVTIRVGIGTDEPPTDPKFHVKVSWDDIEDVRDGELTPAQLLGRLRIEGDASRAMALAMGLAQRRR